MRKLLYTLIAVLGFTTMSFAQEASNTAHAGDKTELMSSKDSGHYDFIFPSSVSIEVIEKNAENYKTMFSVTFNETSHELTMEMVENTEMNRKIITRMMMSCGVRFVKVNGETLNMSEFAQMHL